MPFITQTARFRRLAAAGTLTAVLPLGFLPGTALPARLAASASTRSATSTGAAALSGVTNVSLGDFVGRQVAVDPATDTAYVVMVPRSTTGTPSVDVIDLATDTVTATVPVGSDAQTLAVDPDTDLIYVVNSGTDSISVIDGTTNAVTATIDLTGLPVNSVYGIAVDPVTDVIYAGLRNSSAEGMVAVINGASNTVTGTITTGMLGFPTSISVDPVTDTVYAGFSPEFGVADNLCVISGATQSATSLINTGGDPEGIAVDPATNVFYVSNGGAVIAYSGASGAVLASVTLTGEPRDVAVNPDTDTIYATSSIGASNVTLISGADNEMAATMLELVTGPIAVNPDTDTVVAVTALADGYNLTIIPLQAPSITSGAVATFTTGEARNVLLDGTGTPVPAFSVSGTLPAGLTLTSSGVLSGAPAAGTGGSYPLTITAANGVAPDATQAFTLYVRQEPAITSADSVTFQPGVSGTFTVRATGYPAPGVAVFGGLPPGLTVVAGKGTLTISGTPASADAGRDYLVTVTASNGVELAARQHLTIAVS